MTKYFIDGRLLVRPHTIVPKPATLAGGSNESVEWYQVKKQGFDSLETVAGFSSHKIAQQFCDMMNMVNGM